MRRRWMSGRVPIVCGRVAEKIVIVRQGVHTTTLSFPFNGHGFRCQKRCSYHHPFVSVLRKGVHTTTAAVTVIRAAAGVVQLEVQVPSTRRAGPRYGNLSDSESRQPRLRFA